MTQEIVSTINVGDILEIVRHDENKVMDLRRVRVVSVRTKGGYHYIVGSNLHGQNAWDYKLPLYSWPDIIVSANNIGWFPFIDDPEFEG